MKYLHKLILALIILTSSQAIAQQTEKELFKNNYKPKNSSTILAISNSFGNISLANWDKNEIEVVVTLQLEGYNEKETSKILDDIEITGNETSSEIKVATNLKQKNFKVLSKNKFEINYQIKLPKNQKIELKNSFGNILLQDRTGTTEINIEYGNFTAGKISTITLHQEFGKSEIDYIENGNLDFEYADKVEIGGAEKLEIESEFSKVYIGNLNSLIIDAEYGVVEIAEINDLIVNMEFSSLDVNKVTSTFDCDAEYASGSIKIKELGKDVSKFNLHTEFSRSEISISKNHTIGFISEHSFGDLDIKGGTVNFSKKIKEDFDKNYEGTLGHGVNPNLIMNLSSTYGSIKLNVN